MTGNCWIAGNRTAALGALVVTLLGAAIGCARSSPRGEPGGQRWRRWSPRAAALTEIAPLVTDLADPGTIGLDALAVLSLNATPLDAWRGERVAIVARPLRPKAALEFPFAPMLRELVFAAMLQSEMRTLTPAEWRARVRAAAPPRGGRVSYPQVFHK